MPGGAGLSGPVCFNVSVDGSSAGARAVPIIERGWIAGSCSAALMANERAQMVFADYGCRVQGQVGGLRKPRHKNFVMASGKRDEAELQTSFRAISQLTCDHLIDAGIAEFHRFSQNVRPLGRRRLW